MIGGEVLRLLGQIRRVANIGRQVAQLAGELHARGNRNTLRQCGGVAAADVQLRQPLFIALGVLGTQGGGVAVAGVIGGDHRLADSPRGIAVLDRHFAQCEQRMRHRAGLERARRIADGFQVLRHAKLVGITQTNHQHARCADAGHIVQQRGFAGFAGHIATSDQRLQAACAGGIEGAGGGAQATIGKGAYHDAVDSGGGGRGLVQVELQAHRTRYPVEMCGRRADARRQRPSGMRASVAYNARLRLAQVVIAMNPLF